MTTLLVILLALNTVMLTGAMWNLHIWQSIWHSIRVFIALRFFPAHPKHEAHELVKRPKHWTPYKGDPKVSLMATMKRPTIYPARNPFHPKEDPGLNSGGLYPTDQGIAGMDEELAKMYAELPLPNLRSPARMLSPSYLKAILEKADGRIVRLYLSPETYSDVRKFGRDVFTIESCKEMLQKGLMGKFFDTEVRVSSKIPVSKIALISDAMGSDDLQPNWDPTSILTSLYSDDTDRAAQELQVALPVPMATPETEIAAARSALIEAIEKGSPAEVLARASAEAKGETGIRVETKAHTIKPEPPK